MRIKKLKPCPWCNTNLTITITPNHDYLEVCCYACSVVLQFLPSKTIFDKKQKIEREATDEEKMNETIEKWNSYERKQNEKILNGIMKGYEIALEDVENDTVYDFLKGVKNDR